MSGIRRPHALIHNWDSSQCGELCSDSDNPRMDLIHARVDTEAIVYYGSADENSQIVLNMLMSSFELMLS